MSRTFTVTDYQEAKIQAWMKAQIDKIWDAQRAECPKCKRAKSGKCRDHHDGPYLGATWCGCSYTFVNTGLGQFLSVSFGGETLSVRTEGEDQMWDWFNDLKSKGSQSA